MKLHCEDDDDNEEGNNHNATVILPEDGKNIDNQLVIDIQNKPLESNIIEIAHNILPGFYNCPIFEGSPESSGSKLILTVPIPAGPKGHNYWVQRRVALYMNRY